MPADPIIIECPHCQARALKRKILSGNTFGAKSWSDGKMEAPMLPDFPKVVKCHSCNDFYWVEEAQEIGRVRGVKDEASKLPCIDFPSLEEYVELLKSNPNLGNDNRVSQNS